MPDYRTCSDYRVFIFWGLKCPDFSPHCNNVFYLFLARHIDRKLQISNLELFALSPGKPPYKIAVYVPGTKV